MITQYVQPLGYLNLLNRKSQEKSIKKERTHGDSNCKSLATELKPLFKIDLPGNMVDGASLRTRSSLEISKTKKKIMRLPSEKSMTKDEKEGKTSPKRILNKTIKILPVTFDNISGGSEQEIPPNLSPSNWQSSTKSATPQKSMARDEKEGRTSTKREPRKTNPDIFDNIHVECEHDEIKQKFIPSAWQSSPKPSSFRDRIEYFKVVKQGQEHLRKRVDSTNVMVGINGRSVEDANIAKIESTDSKSAGKRIPVSWEDQLSNFSEDVKTVKSKNLHHSSRQTNCCENIQINIQQPTSKLIWRQMVKPFSNSSNPITKIEYKNCYPEQVLPASPTFIQIPKLRVNLRHRYITHCGAQRAPAAPKISKTRSNSSVEELTATQKAFQLLSPQVCRIKSSQPVRSNKTIENEMHGRRAYLERASLTKKHAFDVLPEPSQTSVTEEYFHVAKIDTWLPYKAHDKKKRKYRREFEDLMVSQNHQDKCDVSGCGCKTEVAHETEYKTNIPVRMWQKKNPAVKLVKPVRFHLRDTTTLEIRGKDPTKIQEKVTSTKNARMIDFRIPFCAQRDPEEDDDQYATEGDSVEMGQFNDKYSGETKGARWGKPNKNTFALDRPKTR